MSIMSKIERGSQEASGGSPLLSATCAEEIPVPVEGLREAGGAWSTVHNGKKAWCQLK